MKKTFCLLFIIVVGTVQAQQIDQKLQMKQMLVTCSKHSLADLWEKVALQLQSYFEDAEETFFPTELSFMEGAYLQALARVRIKCKLAATAKTEKLGVLSEVDFYLKKAEELWEKWNGYTLEIWIDPAVKKKCMDTVQMIFDSLKNFKLELEAQVA